MQAVSLPKVALSRFDLFHAHLFCERTSNQLGMLFHAHEYPAMGPDFKINLGFCQRGSNLEFNAHAMDFRNLIWFELSAQCQLVPAGGHKPLLLATVVVRLVPEWRQRLPRALLPSTVALLGGDVHVVQFLQPGQQGYNL
eukprot:jgi/Astpho2/2779/Aster-x1098